jgi:hypothetical protein
VLINLIQSMLTTNISVLINLIQSMFTISEGSCAFPMNSGTWLSTDKGNLVVISSEITNYPTSSLGNIDLACYTSSGNRYVAR